MDTKLGLPTSWEVGSHSVSRSVQSKSSNTFAEISTFRTSRYYRPSKNAKFGNRLCQDGGMPVPELISRSLETFPRPIAVLKSCPKYRRLRARNCRSTNSCLLSSILLLMTVSQNKRAWRPRDIAAHILEFLHFEGIVGFSVSRRSLALSLSPGTLALIRSHASRPRNDRTTLPHKL
jgi:hypothetical protein